MSPLGLGVKPPKIRRTILETAASLITGDREREHGDALDNFELVAAYWSAHLNITATDVPTMMELFKIARRKSGKYHKDNYVDAAGYAALSYEIACETKKK